MDTDKQMAAKKNMGACIHGSNTSSLLQIRSESYTPRSLSGLVGTIVSFSSSILNRKTFLQDLFPNDIKQMFLDEDKVIIYLYT